MNFFEWNKDQGCKIEKERSFSFISKPASFSTNANPGSEEKISILKYRLANGEELWHHEDNIDCEEINKRVRHLGQNFE